MTVQALTFPGPDLIRAREYGLIPVAPSDVLGDDGRLLISNETLKHYIRVDFKDGVLSVNARGVSGLIPLTDRITVQVTPRFPLANLTHMVAVCGYAPTRLAALRRYDEHSTMADWLWEVYAEGLLAVVDVIEQQGLLRSYVRRYGASSSPHGRTETTTTMLRRASRGIRHIADFSWFERTVDTPENRCIKEAATRLHRHFDSAPRVRGSRERIARLGNALRLLADVAPDPYGASLRDPAVAGLRPLPESRAYYREALDLAAAVVMGRGIDLDSAGVGGSLALPSLLVKTEDLFEDFVRIGLQRAFTTHPEILVVDGNTAAGQLPLYEGLNEHDVRSLPPHAQSLPASAAATQPDLVFRHRDGSTPIVGDVKYTNVTEHAGRSEVEQVVLYGARYSSRVVLTVHPLQRGTQAGLFVSGKIGGCLVAHYRLDLAAPDLEAEVDRMAEALRPWLAVSPPE